MRNDPRHTCYRCSDRVSAPDAATGIRAGPEIRKGHDSAYVVQVAFQHEPAKEEIIQWLLIMLAFRTSTYADGGTLLNRHHLDDMKTFVPRLLRQCKLGQLSTGSPPLLRRPVALCSSKSVAPLERKAEEKRPTP